MSRRNSKNIQWETRRLLKNIYENTLLSLEIVLECQKKNLKNHILMLGMLFKDVLKKVLSLGVSLGSIKLRFEARIVLVTSYGKFLDYESRNVLED